MCQESLIAYLHTHTPEALHPSVEKLIRTHKVDDCLQDKSNATLIQKLLVAVKICDPAIGSGAFPMGMLNEIFMVRRLLFGFLGKNQSFSACLVKKEIIQNNIYGVDIEQGAVDIARLRFWLALVVDEDVPQALPNLDYKIMCGNSLISRFALDAPIKDVFAEYNKKYKTNFTLQDYKNLVNEYTDVHNSKEQFRAKIEEIKGAFKSVLLNSDLDDRKKIEAKVLDYEAVDVFGERKADKDKKGYKTAKSKLEKFLKSEKDTLDNKLYINSFEWRFEFPSLLDDNGNFVGFDVVIGNPPYVRQERLSNEYKTFLTKAYSDVGNGIADLYVYFFGLGLKILLPKGVMLYITLNKYLKTLYGKELRKTLSSNVDVDLIIDFFELPVFEASTDAAITKVINFKTDIQTRYFPIRTLDNLNLYEITRGYYKTAIKEDTEWKFIDNTAQSVLEKLYFETTTLKEFVNDKIFRGITTGLNDAFVLKHEDAKKLLGSESKSIVKPFAKSTDIKQWYLKDYNKKFLATGFSLDVKNDYPTAFQYLSQFQDALEARCDKGVTCFNLRACAYYEDFDKPKIIYIHTAKDHEFYFDTDGCYINNSCYMIGSESRFLFCFLNSKMFKWFKKIKFVAYGDGAEAGRCKLDYNKMVTIPIKKNVNETPFIELVNDIQSAKKSNLQSDTSSLEQQIDLLVYKLYELSYEEVLLIEPDFGQRVSVAEYEKVVVE